MKNKSSEWLDFIELGFDSISLKCGIHMKTVYQDENSVVLVENSVEWKPCINRACKSLKLFVRAWSSQLSYTELYDCQYEVPSYC